MTNRERSHRNNVTAARQLRRPLTPTERILWEQLRARRLDGLKFRRQHPVGPFVLDFYCDELHLAIEVDGGIHSTNEQARRDAERQALLEETGIRFIRIHSADIETNLEAAITALQIRIRTEDDRT
ncbi:MAG: endonuclease domain-containing protein [Dehalococcoidia bacterium]